MPGIWFSREGNKERTAGHIFGAIPITMEECLELLKLEHSFFEEPPIINPQMGDRSWDNPSFVVVELEADSQIEGTLEAGFYALLDITPNQIWEWLGSDRITPYWNPPVLTL